MLVGGSADVEWAIGGVGVLAAVAVRRRRSGDMLGSEEGVL